MLKVLKIILVIILVPILLAAGYIIWLQSQYYRIEDNTDLSASIVDNQAEILTAEQEYSILTSNIGFGAYDREFSFFFDVGTMKDGTEVTGKLSRGRSEEAVATNTANLIELLLEKNTDFVLLQEVDSDSTRSYHINQMQQVRDNLMGYGSVYDINFHSAYLFYPIMQPHGEVKSGLLTMSKYQLSSAVHRQLFITDDFIDKFFDLDRCCTVNRLAVDNGKELVLIHAHLSAYDEGGLSRKEQTEFLAELVQAEYDKGNYVILAGDFNQELSAEYPVLPTEQLRPGWLYTFPSEKLGDNFRVVHSDNSDKAGTCRASEIVYQKGVNYETIVDGFIVSDNITASSQIIDTEYLYSDHNPVLMKFSLKKDQ